VNDIKRYLRLARRPSNRPHRGLALLAGWAGTALGLFLLHVGHGDVSVIGGVFFLGSTFAAVTYRFSARRALLYYAAIFVGLWIGSKLGGFDKYANVNHLHER
jgi:hypothetical protein